MPTSPRPPSSAIKYVSFATPKDPSSDVIDVSSVTTEFNTLFETVVEVAEQVDPIKLNQTLTATADALDGLGERFDDNPNLNRVLEQLRTISGVLSERRMDLSDTLTSLSKFIVSLGEALASGPYFKVMLANLAPYWLLQPLRRRRLQEARHRSGGVLGQRRTAGLPLPGSQRHRVLQRRPAARPDPAGRHPGQSRAGRRPRIAVLLHPGPRRRPDPGQPAALRGPDRRAVRRQPVRTELRRAGSQRGHVAAQRPRTAAVPGCARLGDPRSAFPDRSRARVPLPPAPPGARTVPLEPQPSAPDFTPGIAPLPPALDGPPPPPGPGLTLPPAGEPPLPGNPPFLPPGSQG